MRGWFVAFGDLIVGGYVCCCLVVCFIMDLPGWFCKLICLVDFVVGLFIFVVVWFLFAWWLRWLLALGRVCYFGEFVS